MKNPRSDPTPGASTSQESGEDSGRIKGRDVAGVEKTSAWTGEKKTKVQTTPSGRGMTAGEKGLEQMEGFDWDQSMLKEELDSYYKRYLGLPDSCDDDAWAPIDDQQLKEMMSKFALCRIKAHKMLKGEELSIEELRSLFPPATLEEEGYYHWYERDFDWYFDPEYCKFAHLEDYQRLALRNTGYLEWEHYHDTCSTLRSDQEFIYFWETLSSKTKWIKNFLSNKRSEQERVDRVVFYHAVKIAKNCTHMFTPLIDTGYKEYLWSIRFDNSWYEVFACFYFEIWKLVAKQKMGFEDALDQVKEKDMSFWLRYELEAELNQQWWPGPITRNYRDYLAGIDENLTDAEAYKLVMEAVKKIVPKPKSYYEYAKKKLHIAEKIGLIPPSTHIGTMWQNSSEVTA